jgi:peptide/nickel transport system substrate-binding protein
LRTRKALGAAAVLAAAAAVAAPGSQSRPTVGGTYRVGVQTDGFGVERLPWSDGLDPTGEFRREAFAIYSNLVLRTLVGYDHVAGAAGYKLVPDLAVSVPQAADRGRSYAFTLKSGVRFGPPVDREITSRDVRYAVERLARPRNGSLYARTFDVIRGFDAYRAGKAPSISGIATPNKRTIRFTLTRATGDFPHRLTMPGTAPIPPEVGKCFEGRPGEYGRDLISSGPYMIQGSKAIRIGSCSAIRPMAGISDAQLVLVRNPSYDAKTDSRAARENSPDRFVFVASTSPFSILTKLEAGELEDSFLTAGPKVVGKYAERAKRRGLLHVDSADWVFWITMNLTRPPFDDVHVRRAMNWVLDRAALQDAWGGPAAGPIAQHVVPDQLLGNRLERFAPFKTPGDHGDLARARAELARSKYANRGGVCTAKACKGIHITGFLGPGFGPYAAYPREFASLVFGVVYAPSERMAPILKAAAARLGLTFKEHLGEAGVPADNVPISQPENWYKSYSDPASYLEPLFAGDGIVPRGGFNFSLVGLTPAQAAKLHVQGRVTGVPSVDADLARCGALLGSPRFDCYAALDRKLTTQVVPWIPVLSKNQLTILGPQVANWRFDQATGVTALAHVALKR